ncbi:interleukin-3 receptor subunit alpha-like isoform X2 [Mastomys coucha]|uniref:interleukin-3 receptor subunit alpha-like isoform X2 n=1 Tax=Mastomys coucha TaxID=35658 RepID=UPI001262760F|nr:interleukin-3 receptor subunit alpha-like isoform X2 [Mastomys coucha]
MALSETARARTPDGEGGGLETAQGRESGRAELRRNRGHARRRAPPTLELILSGRFRSLPARTAQAPTSLPLWSRPLACSRHGARRPARPPGGRGTGGVRCDDATGPRWAPPPSQGPAPFAPHRRRAPPPRSRGHATDHAHPEPARRPRDHARDLGRGGRGRGGRGQGQVPVPQGGARPHPAHANPGSAPRDLRCAVREVDAVTPTLAMTCRWRRGPAAHADLRYRMFWRDARLRPDHDLECARPEADLDSDGGERCTVTLDLGRDPVTLVIVTVNASHGGGAASGGVAGAAAVACRDIPVDLVQAEELAPPTLTGVCNGSEARMSWAVRSHFHHKFEFTLQINRSSHAEPQFVQVSRPRPSLLRKPRLRACPPTSPPRLRPQVQDKHFEILNARALSIRVQASWAEGLRVSGWSPALRLACDPATPAEEKSAMMAAWLAAGTGMTFLLLLLLLLWRKSMLARLCPPIPRMRVPVGSTMEAMTLGETVAWAVGAEDCEVTRVTEA